MRRNLFAVLVAAVVVGVSAPSWAVEHGFFSDALDINNPVGGVENAVFIVTVRNDIGEPVWADQMLNFGGALYFVVEDAGWGPNCTWEVDLVGFNGPPNWNLINPLNWHQEFGQLGVETSHDAGVWWFEAAP